jgi:hypothetical protein
MGLSPPPYPPLDDGAGTEPKSAYGVPSGRLLTEPAPTLGPGWLSGRGEERARPLGLLVVALTVSSARQCLVSRRQYVARGVPGGYRIWDNKRRRWWGDLFDLCPDDLLNELNELNADYQRVTALLKRYRAQKR